MAELVFLLFLPVIVGAAVWFIGYSVFVFIYEVFSDMSRWD